MHSISVVLVSSRLGYNCSHLPGVWNRF